ncbi:hypothetical protein TNCV_1546751 [Trichonephila clavipes]|nr:hypothetical protein TNCV_1546751 [Trichonephila clavipes]
MAGLRPYSESQVMLGSPAMREPTKMSSMKTSRPWRELRLLPVFVEPTDMTFWEYHWLSLAADEVCSLCGHIRMDGDHLLQCTELKEYPAGGIVNRYMEAQCQIVKKPSAGAE